MVNYSNGKIYKIVSDSCDLVYYGSTVQSLAKRMGGHRKDYTRLLNGISRTTLTSFEILKHGDAKIFLVECVDVKTKEELLSRERYWIENNECVNRQIPIRTKEEYVDIRRMNYENNKEHVSQWGKKYREENKDICDARSLHYRQNHREQEAERSRTWYENNKERAAERNKKRYEENKEQIHERNYKKETCECGSEFMHQNKLRHMKSMKHQKFIQELKI